MPATAASDVGPAIGGRQVLIADDSRTVRRVLAAAIERWGFEAGGSRTSWRGSTRGPTTTSRSLSLGAEPLRLSLVERATGSTYGLKKGVILPKKGRIEGAIRASDAFGRSGGEEFLVLWPGADATTVRIAGERVRERIAAQTFAAGTTAIPMTASIGVTSSDGHEDPDAVVARADGALYGAKGAGRDRLEVEAPRRLEPCGITRAR